MKYVAIDIEAINLKPFQGTIWMLSITENNKSRVYHDCYGFKKLPVAEKKMLMDEKVCKIIHSSQYDVPYIELVLGVKIRNIWDTELSETVILGMKLKIKKRKDDNVDPNSAEGRMLKRYGTALKYVLPRYGFPEPDKTIREAFIDRPIGKAFTKKEIKYAEDDTKYLPKMQRMQEAVLTRDSLIEVALLENKASERYHDMKVRGIGFDQDIWRDVYKNNAAEFKRRLSILPKQVNNWNSPAQVKEYFKNKGILIPTFDDLDKVYLQTRNKTLGDFIATREFQRSVTTYGLNWFEEDYIDSDGRIRCDVTQIINTGRNSMSKPNLQQLPGSGNNDPLRLKVIELVTGDKKKKPQHRRAFVPAPGNVFVIGDFSGQEIGVMAAASGEELWINALLRGDDVHGLTASIVSPQEWRDGHERGCKFPKKCKCPGHIKLREPAKIQNFRLAYGGGIESFADFMGWDRLDASKYIGMHKRAIPTLTRYLEINGREAQSTGIAYSADPYRRRIVLMGEEAWQVRNQGMNYPIQSAGANMLKLAMVSLPWKYPIVLVIHDEIICEVPKAMALETAHALKTVMEKAASYITGIKGLIKVDPKIQMNIMKDLPETKKMNSIVGGEFSYMAA
jgi:DNA polymerase I-like protein with 3'-5' exonuclease and polymerase domains